MSSLGIYFGSKVISLVENKGKKILNNSQISRLSHSLGELGEKVPEELKIVAILKEELRRNQIKAEDAFIALSGKDLIIRNFEMPVLPREELETAINFEAKKYIPFKVEDLVSVSQVKFDRSSRRNLVLFVGIKKETLDKYLSVFKQLDIKPNIIEYSAFSALRFIESTGLRYKGIMSIINIDLQEEKEVNFMVLENGFPLFSRDITLLGGPEELMAVQEPETASILEKLKTELRVSMDYYNRKFPLKKITKAAFLSAADLQADLEALAKELGIAAQFIEASRYIEKQAVFSPSLIKAYGCSLFQAVRSELKLNLLAVKAKIKPAREGGVSREAPFLFSGIKVSPWAVMLGLSICILVFLSIFIYKIRPLEQEIKNIIVLRPAVSTVNPEASYEELTKAESSYNNKIKNVDGLLKKEIYATQILDVLPRIIPQGSWLVNLALRGKENNRELALDGMSYLADNTKELESVNSFLLALKVNPVFSRYFKEINLVSVDAKIVDQKKMTSFVVSCRVFKNKR
jgi:Tfp pilus assembly protein PilN